MREKNLLQYSILSAKPRQFGCVLDCLGLDDKVSFVIQSK